MKRFTVLDHRLSTLRQAPNASPSNLPSRLLNVLLLTFCALAFGCAQAPKTAAKEYMFWPPAPDAPHIQFLTSISSTAQITLVQNDVDRILYGKELRPALPFERPFGIRMFNGCIYVCDASSANISILDMRKHEVRILGTSGAVTLMKPIDIAVAPDGTKYVADTGHGAIIVYDASDKYAGSIKVADLRPVSVAVRGDELFVADMVASVIRVFDRFNGKQVRTIGKRRTPEATKGELGGVMGIALDDQGNIYANDVIGCRVQKFSPDGNTVLASVGGVGDAPGHFFRPKLMAVDSDGILYVVDNAYSNVQMFNDKNQWLMFFGAPGTHPGAMDSPAGICTSDKDLDLFQQYVHPDFQLQRLILVTNNVGGNKINVYGLGVLKPGKTVADLAPARVNRVVGFDSSTKSSMINTQEPGSTLGPSTQPTTQPVTTTAPATRNVEPGQKPF